MFDPSFIIIPVCVITVFYVAFGFLAVWVQHASADPGAYSAQPTGRVWFLSFAWIDDPTAYRLVSVAILLLWPLYVLLSIVLFLSYAAAMLFRLVFGLEEWKKVHAPLPEPEPETHRFEHRMAVERLVVRRGLFGRREQYVRRR